MLSPWRLNKYATMKRPCIVYLLAFFFVGCDSQLATPGDGSLDGLELQPQESCSLNNEFLYSATGKDVIPALTDPPLVDASQVDYLQDHDFVLGLTIGGQSIAIPHNIMWHHEIINLNTTDPPLTVTFCPLTGSGIAFDRSVVGNVEFGVSGLLYQNNLVLYDRRDSESLWPQMTRSAKCGPAHEQALLTIPMIETTWKNWRSLHPATWVISETTGFSRDYRTNPYGNYGETWNSVLLYDMPVDKRLPAKQRVLGIPRGSGGLAIPMSHLDNGSTQRVVQTTIGAQELVIFWSKESQTATVFQLGQDDPKHFEVGDTGFTDPETGSSWLIDGRAIAGNLKGRQLKPLAASYTAFWFAWAAFHPSTEIWTPEN